jgi:hypothetical protein
MDEQSKPHHDRSMNEADVPRLSCHPVPSKLCLFSPNAPHAIQGIFQDVLAWSGVHEQTSLVLKLRNGENVVMEPL